MLPLARLIEVKVIKSVIVFIALLSHGTPPDIAAGAMLGATAYAIPSHIMAGYLVSGHPGARYSGRCGDPKTIKGGTCGPYRLGLDRVKDYGVAIRYRDQVRRHRILSALPAGHMLSRARRVHNHGEGRRRPCREEKCIGWRVHPKAGTKSRTSPRARWKVRRQLKAELELCGKWCRAAVMLP